MPPATCSIKDWLIFGPGYHKERLYSPERCRQIARTFARLRSHTTPRVKIGHDRQQRLARSLGFLSMGEVTACRATTDGYLTIDITGLPVEVGAEISAGRLNAGSVELTPNVSDPDDPRRTVDDVLTAVALLGEEQPAVRGWPERLRQMATPRAVFEDGSPVPPARSASPWLSAMAAVTLDLAHSAGEHVISFSQMTFSPNGVPTMPGLDLLKKTAPTDKTEMSDSPDEIRAKLEAAGLSPEVIEQVIAALGATPPPAAGMSTSPDGGPGGDPMAQARQKMSDEIAADRKKLETREREFAAFTAGATTTKTGARLTAFQRGMLESESMRRQCPGVRERLLGRR